MTDLACQPHARCLQYVVIASIHIPSKVITITFTVHTCATAVVVPESSAPAHRSFFIVLVVVTVIRGELRPVMVRKSVSSRVTRVPRYMHPVFGCLAVDNKPTVLGIVPAAVGRMQVKPELVSAIWGVCKLMKQVVAEPVVAIRVVESDFILRPRTVEKVDRPDSRDFVLDQQRKTVG